MIIAYLELSDCGNTYYSSLLCDMWATSGECDSNPDLMSENCRESCRQCPELPGKNGLWALLLYKQSMKVHLEK